MNDVIVNSGEMIYRHNVSENIPRDAYSMHIHNAYELIYFLDGDAGHVIEDRKYKLKRGDLILIRPMSYHFIQIESQCRYERYNVQFDPKSHGVEGLELIPDSLEVVSLEGNAAAEDIFRRCDLYRKSCTDEIFFKILPHLLSELFYNIHAFLGTARTNEGAQISPLISEFLQYVNENICSPIDIGRVADRLFVSESYLFRLFKRELHQTPQKYIREKRLMMAQKMLSEGERPTDVCTRCGFSDYTTFYRNYVSFFCRPPSQNCR
ncbi:MAG: helix-turn-helix transcriptional regulator [Clostridia bacterium]|nr:helix-turn-helix transcriptional regulator [Clostridia bacterium]